MKIKTVIILALLFVFSTGVVGLFSQETGSKVKKNKKYEFEIAVGIGRADPREIYDRGAGIDTLIAQYSNYYQLSNSFTGEFKESKLVIPLSVTVNYHLKEKLYLRAGIDYSGNSATSQKVYQVAWPDFNENHDYEITNKVSVLMPHAGAGYRTDRFDIYGSLGAGFASFTHIEALNYSEPGYSHRITETFKVNGTGIGLILGGKYHLPLPKKIAKGSLRAFVKLEAVLLKIGTLTGTKQRAASNSAGGNSSETTEGTLYRYTWNPNSLQGFDWWDIFETAPTSLTIGSAQEMGLNLSGIRVMIGVSF